jgi:hypothetical protein
VWILPWLLSLDNITYGTVDGVSHGASIGLSAFEQSESPEAPCSSRPASCTSPAERFEVKPPPVQHEIL